MKRRSDPADAEVGLYTDPLVYDILHAPGTAEELRGLSTIASRFARTRATRQTWLEPACGSGRLLVAAARAGHRPIGFDLLPAMVAYASKRLGHRGRVFQASMTDFAVELKPRSVDVAFCTINTIRHLESDAAVLEHFEQVSRVLRPEGVYIVGLSTTIRGGEAPIEDVWEGGRGKTRVKQIVSFLPPERGRFERALSHLIVTRGEEVEHRDSAYLLRTYTRSQWLKVIERSRLELRAVTDAAGRSIDPPTLGYALWVLGPRSNIA